MSMDLLGSGRLDSLSYEETVVLLHIEKRDEGVGSSRTGDDIGSIGFLDRRRESRDILHIGRGHNVDERDSDVFGVLRDLGLAVEVVRMGVLAA